LQFTVNDESVGAHRTLSATTSQWLSVKPLRKSRAGCNTIEELFCVLRRKTRTRMAFKGGSRSTAAGAECAWNKGKRQAHRERESRISQALGDVFSTFCLF